jgi:hypothetical protein
MPITEVLVKPQQFEEAKKLIRPILQPHADEVLPAQTPSELRKKGRYHFIEDAASLSVSWEDIPNGEALIRGAMYEEDAPTSYGVSS